MTTALTKLDVAHRQLAVAIRLFFDDQDPVSVYTLAANAWEIVDKLCRIRDVDSLSEQTRGNLSNGQSLRRDLINQPYRNFFKHADKDPEGAIKGFSDEKNDHLLMLAVEDLLRLEQTKLFECQFFQTWYLAVYEEKIANEALKSVLPRIRQALPGMGKLSRSEQKRMGRELLQRTGNDEELLSDPLTGISELNRWEGLT